jgi:hypothetical protein
LKQSVRHFGRNIKKHVGSHRGDAQPDFVLLDEWEDFLVGDGVFVADDEELFAVFDELGDILAEERERRVGDDDVRLFQELDALWAAEVAAGVLVVALERDTRGVVAPQEDLHIGDAYGAVAVLILHAVDDDGERLGTRAIAVFGVVLWEQHALPRDGRAVVTGGDEPLETEPVEVGGEILEKVAFVGVVAVAVDDLAAKGVGVVLQVRLDLSLDVVVLGVELILFGNLRVGKRSVARAGSCRYGHRFASCPRWHSAARLGVAYDTLIGAFAERRHAASLQRMRAPLPSRWSVDRGRRSTDHERRSTVRGRRSTDHGRRSTVRGAWSIDHGRRSTVRGAWSTVREPWSVDRGRRRVAISRSLPPRVEFHQRRQDDANRFYQATRP